MLLHGGRQQLRHVPEPAVVVAAAGLGSESAEQDQDKQLERVKEMRPNARQLL